MNLVQLVAMCEGICIQYYSLQMYCTLKAFAIQSDYFKDMTASLLSDFSPIPYSMTQSSVSTFMKNLNTCDRAWEN